MLYNLILVISDRVYTIVHTGATPIEDALRLFVYDALGNRDDLCWYSFEHALNTGRDTNPYHFGVVRGMPVTTFDSALVVHGLTPLSESPLTANRG